MFRKTMQALLDLQQILHCANCNVKCQELSYLGSCEHRFCKECVEYNAGYPCPRCGIPSTAKKSSIDKQLSNVAKLCSLMLDIIKGESTPLSKNIQDCSIDTKQEIEGTGILETNQTDELDTPPRDDSINKRNTVTSKRRRNSLERSNHNSIEYLNEKDDSFVRIKDASQIDNHNSSAICLDNEPEICTPNIRKKRTSSSKNCHSNKKSRKSEDVDIIEIGNISQSSTPKSKEKLQTPKVMTNQMLKESGKITPEVVSMKKMRNLNKRNAKGETPLQVATIKMNIEEVKRLLDAGANPNVKDNAGWTPLHEAIGKGCTDIAALLVSSGASVNAPGLDNETPLHDAVMNQFADCVRLLTEHGANVFARNSHGHTPLDIAQNDNIKEILLSVSQSLAIGEDLPLLDESNKPLCFTTSSLSKEQSKLLTHYCKEMQAKLVPDITAEVTHLITTVNDQRTCSRTFKYLHALLSGKWIVDFKWLESSVANKCCMAEEDFQVTGNTTHPISNAPNNARLNRLKQLPPLFDGCQFYFYGKPESNGLSKEQLTTLVKHGGGSILTREPHIHNLDDYPYTHPYHTQNTPSLRDCTIYKIYDNNYTIPSTVQSQRMSSLPTSWLIDSIMMFSILDKSNYVA